MALGVVNLVSVEQTRILSVNLSSSIEVSRQGSGAGVTLVFSNSIDRNSSRRSNRSFVASPLALAMRVSPRVNLRTRQAEKSCILGGQGYAMSRAYRGKGLAIAAAGSAGAEFPLDPNMGSGEESNELNKEVVTEVQLSGDDTEVEEIGDSLYSVKTLQKLVFKIGDGGKQFVVNTVGGVVGIFKKDKNKKQPELVAFEASSYESKDGKTALSQWTATELTMQHNQLVRIATDLNYLVFAFAFFGWVRVLEAILAAFSTNPAKLRKLGQATNAMDPLTVAWLAYNLRKPILGILQVDPTDFQKLATLKGKLWEELHAFFERQWKVMATLAMVRFLGLVANNIPASQWITSKVKTLWDVMMMIPIF
ncbi:hypothetical protein KC19_3G199900 [Ceratodon purpureus]|uniref:Uncharacterized protein n=1 Tax=Ceratodon purpureus TaxID=3225 RepID=A0A8T0IMT2_CERPU|nr:hypothetical protein KC19_3G199900 [Ceratodon purpureus]KAG0584288.1 hypothetical protein KC19_3G199900 [Ceratodon purpureus]KAG0584289.1 hypothetical protein KC19_3G199900 [Ceratodon purpureus]KAG0584290.1 hypothetical protein KC19_3G199900 [Ceratodon purpureus]